MSVYQYSVLPEGNIRLLHLQPHRDTQSPIRCKLSNIKLIDSEPYLFEALSYVWGSGDKPHFIEIDGCTLAVGAGLFAALISLRQSVLERVMWVDAICINQENIQEKGHQVQLMAKIYAKAFSVIVWLGEMADESGRALEEIRATAADVSNGLERSLPENQSMIMALLRRPWFQRIWVLQEVAAARQILIKCGPAQLDGHAFCIGLNALKYLYSGNSELSVLVHSVLYLMRGAIFRPRHIVSTGRFSLNICPLGVLLEMYHTRKATELHDKIFALLGMCTDDLETAGLLVDYTISWQKLLQKTINYIFPQCLSIHTWDGEGMAIIETMGCVLGTVLNVYSQWADRWADSQELEISWEVRNSQRSGRSCWNIKTSGKSVRIGDIICLLGEASSPTIIRPCRLHWEIIMISFHQTDPSIDHENWRWTDVAQLPGTYFSKFQLVWDWNIEVNEEPVKEARLWSRLSKIGQPIPSSLPTNNQQTSLLPLHDKQGILSDIEYRFYEIVQISSIGQKLFMLAHREAEAYLKESLRILDGVLSGWETPEATGNGDDLMNGDEQGLDLIVNNFIGILGGWLPLHWAVEDRHYYAARWLLPHADPNVEIKGGLTPLTWAATTGYDNIVRLVLHTGKAAPDSPDNKGRTPLLLASKHGHDAVVKLLLETGQVRPDAKDMHDRTPLLEAALNEHETVVQLLLETGKVNPNAREGSSPHHAAGRTPLICAAQNGYVGISRLLLEHEEVDIYVRDDLGATPYEWALLKGHEDIYHLMADKLDSNARETVARGLEELRKKINHSPHRDLTYSMPLFR